MAVAQSTNMADLVADIAQHIKDEVKTNGKLPSVRKVSTEPLVNPAVFPFITVTPINEIFQGYRGDKMHMLRTIRVEMVAKKGDSRSSMRQTMGMTEQVKNIFKVNADDYLVPDRQSKSVDTLMDLEIVNVETSNKAAPFRNGFLHVSAMEFACHSFDPIFTSDYLNVTVRNAEATETDSKTLVDNAANMIKTARLASTIFRDVKSLKSFTLPPQLVYPVVFVSIEEESRDHTFAGQDSVDRSIGINILTKVKSRQKSLDRNVDLADRCRQVIMKYPDFNGACYNMGYVGTTYGQITTGSDLVFGTQVLFNTQSYESLPTS